MSCPPDRYRPVAVPNPARYPDGPLGGGREGGEIMQGRLVGIAVYALKSARGVQVETAEVEPWGLCGDRRWAVVHPDGRRLRAAEVPAILGVTARPAPGGALHLSAPARPRLGEIEVRPPAGAALDVKPGAFLDVARLVPGDDPAAEAWLSAAIGRPVRLVWLDPATTRPIAAEHGGTGAPDDVVSLADTGPLLLTSLSSLRRLDDWVAELALERGEGLPDPLDMRRFRPNVVVEGFEPFAEDAWSGVRIGDVTFRVTEQCDRCAMTLYDPDTIERGKEPIRTLARHRRRDGLTWFGVRMAPVTRGEVRLGDPVVPVAPFTGVVGGAA
jgi:uncharacterized protein YcbX